MTMNKHMRALSMVYIYSEQPATCPKCGARTEITWESNKAPEYTSHHRCMFPFCEFEFVMEADDEEIDHASLK